MAAADTKLLTFMHFAQVLSCMLQLVITEKCARRVVFFLFLSPNKKRTDEPIDGSGGVLSAPEMFHALLPGASISHKDKLLRKEAVYREKCDISAVTSQTTLVVRLVCMK